jgi:hypothetical protein
VLHRWAYPRSERGPMPYSLQAIHFCYQGGSLLAMNPLFDLDLKTENNLIFQTLTILLYKKKELFKR